jgi:hypothetical protein
MNERRARTTDSAAEEVTRIEGVVVEGLGNPYISVLRRRGRP